ncbi:MAG: hypothetical protein K0S39_2910 [Paenibacillus sp.]|jgi:hypothetical protein|nr:hypothetical protein [Paenibacillus sp.]
MNLDLWGDISVQYIKCIWFHDSSVDPVLLYSELDEDRYEVRKIEISRDNLIGYASHASEYNAQLGKVPVPEIEEINKEIEFYAIKITKEEFEIVWRDTIENSGK